ncbi:hypothetical protein MSKOL_1268 [Methanosarcina sp. Kolksee]|uniref:hypothetical protein n=1 Tax=Methanosarcina sp. Kolksee TaxID=1434099 RepID=UPI000615CBE5|nr:hypothetical protein [Methanosarcina sp. Kolksee]AKB47045.1 hypothetical protein MSKOL_1268 [Methanosarcina sp. Kolksee]
MGGSGLRSKNQALYKQMFTKNKQIGQLNEVTQKQAVHIQSLIQENSKLNMKLFPEITEKLCWKLFFNF